MSRDGSARGPASLVPLVAAVALVLAVSIWLAQVPLRSFVTFFPDDAFFYIKTAAFTSQGLGTTFDGINVSNGYHPLYLGLLTALASVVSLEGHSGMRAVFWMDTLLTLGWFAAALAVARVQRWSTWRTTAWLAALLPLAAVGDFGMEPNVLMPLAWGFAVLAWRSDGQPSRAIAAGVVGAFVCLARLDSILFIGGVSFGALVASGGPAWFRRAELRRVAAGLVGPSVVALAAYALANLLVYGRATSVSSWLKMGVQAENSALNMGLEGTVTKVLVGAVVALGLWALAHAVATRDRAAWRGAGLGAWAVGYLAVLALFLRGGMELWYFPLPLSAGVFLACELIGRHVEGAGGRPARLVFAAAALIGVLAAGGMLRYQLSRWWLYSDAVAIGQWIDTHLEPAAVLYQVDNSGVVGYFSRRAVINGDGLINSWDYQRELRAGRLVDYLRATSVSYLVSDEHEAGRPVAVRVPLWNAPALDLTFAAPPEIAGEIGRFVVVRVDPANVRVSPPPR